MRHLVLAGRILTGMVVAIGGLGTTLSHAADYRWLQSWDRSLPQIPFFVEPYLKAVEATSKGSIKFAVSGPEAVPPFEQLQPVAAGAFHFLFTHGGYHFGTSPLLAVVEALGGTPDERRASGVLEAVDKHYQKLGLKLVYLLMTVDGGYQIILRRPLTAAGDLQGYKIRGTPSYTNVIKMLGGTMVNLPPGEIYTAIEKGVVDGFAWPAYGVINTRYYEPAKYILRPAFGFGTNPILANLATWNKMSSADQKIMIDEAVRMQPQWLKDSARLIDEDEKALTAKGLSIVQVGEAYRDKIKRAWSDGLWELASQKFKKEVDEIRAIARGRGLE